MLNAVLAADYSALTALDGRPLLAWVDVEYSLAHGQTLDQAMAQKLDQRPRLIYADYYWLAAGTNLEDFLARLLPGDVPSFGRYRNQHEPLNVFDQSVRSMIVLVSQHAPCIPVCGAFDRTGPDGPLLSERELYECFPVYRTWLDLPSCAGLLFFGLHRPDGGEKYPWLIPTVQNFVSAGVPDFPGGSEMSKYLFAYRVNARGERLTQYDPPRTVTVVPMDAPYVGLKSVKGEWVTVDDAGTVSLRGTGDAADFTDDERFTQDDNLIAEKQKTGAAANRDRVRFVLGV